MYVHFDVSARDLNRFSCIIAFFVSEIDLPDEYLSLSWDKNILFPLLLQQVTEKCLMDGGSAVASRDTQKPLEESFLMSMKCHDSQS